MGEICDDSNVVFVLDFVEVAEVVQDPVAGKRRIEKRRDYVKDSQPVRRNIYPFVLQRSGWVICPS